MFENLVFLVVFPLLAAFLLLFIKSSAVRGPVVRVSAVVIALASVWLGLACLNMSPLFFPDEMPHLPMLMFGLEVFFAGFICYKGFTNKRIFAPVMALVQLGIGAYLEFGMECVHSGREFYVDQLSVLMALVIGIVGSLICVYALGYMKDYHRHYPSMRDRRPFFFFMLFVFLSAMFGLVFSNSLSYLYFFWEVTTLCSFILIGYTQTQEAVDNSFRALNMNLAGGLAFVLGLYILRSYGISSLDVMVTYKEAGVIMIPAALLCFAGITKSAQMPFSSWLLGAMVAPTPTSALLHSSTMVKAGVFILLKMSPIVQNTLVGWGVALVGALTFLFASFMNISERNIKKLLAYSTVANLGLIVMCAGVGSAELVWVGILLILFHAVAKSLLFLVVGTTENRFYTKDMESYDHLIVRMPKISLLYIVGIAGMFLAPFGIVVSKWAAIEALLRINSVMSIVLILVVAYGSGATVFYWTKLLGKIINVRERHEADKKKEESVSGDEWVSEGVHAVLTVAVCGGFPIMAGAYIEPYVNTLYGSVKGISSSDYAIMAIMLGMIVVIPALVHKLREDKSYDYAKTYVSGRDFDSHLVMECSMGGKHEITLKNYYLEHLFGEAKLAKLGNILAIAALVIMAAGAVLWKN